MVEFSDKSLEFQNGIEQVIVRGQVCDPEESDKILKGYNLDVAVFVSSIKHNVRISATEQDAECELALLFGRETIKGFDKSFRLNQYKRGRRFAEWKLKNLLGIDVCNRVINCVPESSTHEKDDLINGANVDLFVEKYKHLAVVACVDSMAIPVVCGVIGDKKIRNLITGMALTVLAPTWGNKCFEYGVLDVLSMAERVLGEKEFAAFMGKLSASNKSKENS